jgi:hypothetical protein
MGALQAREFAANTEITLEQAIGWHLQGNHYPPVPLSMVTPCVEAIDAFWADELDREIDLPEGVSYRGLPTAPAREIIINHHLDAWCVEYDEDLPE